MIKTKYRFSIDNRFKFLDFLNDTECIIAGGSVTSAANFPDIKSDDSDIDIFFLNDDELQKAMNKLKTKKFKRPDEFDDWFGDSSNKAEFLFESTKSYTYRIKRETVQFVKNFKHFDNFDDLIEDFDLDNSKYFSVYPFDTAFSNYKTGHVFSNDIKWSIIERIIKYVDKGFMIYDDFIKKIFNFVKDFKTDEHSMGDAFYNDTKTGEQKRIDYIYRVISKLTKTDWFCKYLKDQENRGIFLSKKIIPEDFYYDIYLAVQTDNIPNRILYKVYTNTKKTKEPNTIYSFPAEIRKYKENVSEEQHERMMSFMKKNYPEDIL